MRRRALLSTLATSAAAGCAESVAGPESHSSPSPEASTSGTNGSTADDTPPLAATTPETIRGISPTGTATRDVSADPITAVRVTRFGDFTLSHRLSVTAGDAGPALTVSVVNDGEVPLVVQTANAPSPFPGARGERTDGDSALVANVAAGAQTEAGGCPRASLALQPMVDRVTLSSGEGAQTEARLFNARENDTCWPVGEYAFEQPLTVWTSETAFEYTWRFVLVI